MNFLSECPTSVPQVCPLTSWVPKPSSLGWVCQVCLRFWGNAGELSDSDVSPRREAGELDPQSWQGVNFLGGSLQQHLFRVTPFPLLRCGASLRSGSMSHVHFLICIFFNLYNRFSATSFRQLFWVGVVIVKALPTMIKKIKNSCLKKNFFFFWLRYRQLSLLHMVPDSKQNKLAVPQIITPWCSGAWSGRWTFIGCRL